MRTFKIRRAGKVFPGSVFVRPPLWQPPVSIPAVRAERLLPRRSVLPSGLPEYHAVSWEVREIFQRHTNLIEPLSLNRGVSTCTLDRGVQSRLAGVGNRTPHEAFLAFAVDLNSESLNV